MVFLLWSGDWQNYFDFNWLINMKLLHGFPVWRHMALGLYISLPWVGFVLLFIAGCMLRPGKTVRLHGLVALTGFCLLASLFIVRAPAQQYFLPAAPFVAMVSAFALHRLFSDKIAISCLAIFVLLCSAYLVFRAGDGSVKRNSIAQAKYILAVSEPGDLYFGPPSRNLFRGNANFFWFCHTKCLTTYQGFRDYDYDPMQIIRETRPKVICIQKNRFHRGVIKHPYLAQNYERSANYPDLFLRKSDD